MAGALDRETRMGPDRQIAALADSQDWKDPTDL
jgi:hypothetical protein